MRVHHRNLTSLIGYCDDGINVGLIYEYMAKGNLSEYLSGLNSLIPYYTIFIYYSDLIYCILHIAKFLYLKQKKKGGLVNS